MWLLQRSVSRRPLTASGAEPMAIKWKTAHVGDLVSKRFLREPFGSGDKCESRMKELPVGHRAYNLGLSLSPKAKTGLSSPACLSPQLCQDSTARYPECSWVQAFVWRWTVQHAIFLKASFSKSFRRFGGQRPSEQQTTEPALTAKLPVLSHPWDHTLGQSWKKLFHAFGKIVLMDDAMDCLMSFSDFLFAFQIQFYYSEFLESVAAIYQDLLAGKNPNTVIVPTSSSSGPHRQRPPLGEASVLEGVEASLFSQGLENLCDRPKYSCPPPALVKEVLSNVQRLTFYGFLVALSKHHGINQALGALPDKGDLMHDPAMDEELERLLAQVPGLVNSAPANPEAGCLPSRTPPRVGSPWRPLHHARKVDAESDGSTEETDESET
ncbi:centriolar satellite-associated tubulin polyglutamylase complex regulator 1 isoform X1 [Mirounga angustirostris]|uniref:centriolar satellite-associated tubulin polyglutamylase complex regulator 1 isoform X1 n=1 Tax=Mirounga angustirostris TaxID=9716 RepID=UPI00313ACDB1